jgi:leucyl-tRNA synthetase
MIANRGGNSKPDLPLAGQADKELFRLVHETIRRVTLDMAERYQFNTAIAALMELTNGLYVYAPLADYELKAGEKDLVTRDPKEDIDYALLKFAVERLALLISPFAPHLAEEIWSQIGGAALVAEQSWPAWDAEALNTDEVEIAIQVSGKVRSRMMVGMEESETSIKERALADDRLLPFLDNRPIRKVIYVKHKLINIVI